VAVAGDCRDESVIRKVDTINEDYRLKEEGAILNWFDITEREGYFSLNDKMGDIMATVGGKLWFAELLVLLKKKMAENKAKEGEGKGMNFDLDSVGNLSQMLASFTVLRLTSMVGMVGVSFTKEDLLAMNAKLNKIKKPA
jgi:beta-galactosidase